MVVLLPIQHPSHFQQMVVEVGREEAWQDPLGEGVADPNLLRLRKMVEEGAMEPRRLRRHHHHHPLNHPRKKGVEASQLAEGAMEPHLLNRMHRQYQLRHLRKMEEEEDRVQGSMILRPREEELSLILLHHLQRMEEEEDREILRVLPEGKWVR